MVARLGLDPGRQGQLLWIQGLVVGHHNFVAVSGKFISSPIFAVGGPADARSFAVVSLAAQAGSRTPACSVECEMQDQTFVEAAFSYRPIGWAGFGNEGRNGDSGDNGCRQYGACVFFISLVLIMVNNLNDSEPANYCCD